MCMHGALIISCVDAHACREALWCYNMQWQCRPKLDPSVPCASGRASSHTSAPPFGDCIELHVLEAHRKYSYSYYHRSFKLPSLALIQTLQRWLLQSDQRNWERNRWLYITLIHQVPRKDGLHSRMAIQPNVSGRVKALQTTIVASSPTLFMQGLLF